MTMTSLAAITGTVCIATLSAWAQIDPYPTEARLRFEVFDGTGWSNNALFLPGQRIEWRAVVDYTGPRTDLFALGEVLYQPTFSNADNSGVGFDADQTAPWRNGGVSSNNIPGSLLTPAEGNSTSQLASYGRVGYGQTAMNTSNENVLTTFRHSAGSNGAPSGDWMRVAGSFVSQWPQYPLVTAPGADGINRIQRGVSSGQTSQALGPSFHQQGVHNLVLFRGQLQLSGSDPFERSLTLTSDVAFLRRAGGPTSSGDRRYMTWQTGPTDAGSYRTMVEFVPAMICFDGCIPSPGTGVVFIGACVFAARRRVR